MEPGVKEEIDKLIRDDVASGAKAGPFDAWPFAHMSFAPMGAVPKPNTDKHRLIVDLSYPKREGGDSINSRIVEKSFKLESFDHATNLVRRHGRGCFLIKFDVEAAYKQIPVREADWPLLGFEWEGKFYFDRTLPFGLRSSCRLWDMFASALHYFFREVIGVHTIHYIDDFLFVIPASKGLAFAIRARDAALAMCARLGLPMAERKTEGPCTRLTFLGIELDTEAQTARLPDAKLDLLTRTLVSWDVPDRRTSIKEMQSLAGQLAFAVKVVRAGRPFMRRIIGEQHRLRRAAFVGGAREHTISATARADVRWWARNLSAANGVSILFDEDWVEAATLTLFTDASSLGFGCSFGTRWLNGAWSAEVMAEAQVTSRYSMPYLELYSLVTAATAWGHLWSGRKITFRCDCMPVVQAVEKMSSAKPAMQTLVRLLAASAARHGYDFRVWHVKGADNPLADALSRGLMSVFFQSCPDAEPSADSVRPLDLRQDA